MAFQHYMNLEPLALEIADEHINKMTDSNVCNPLEGEPFDAYISLDDKAFHNNLKNGWIVVLVLSNYIESVVNTILRDCVYYKGKSLLKANLDDKLEMLYLYYKADISDLKEKHWEHYRKLIRLRNELVHYKYNFVGEGTDIPLMWKAPFEDIGDVFTISKMKKMKEEIIKFCKKIISDFNLAIHPQPQLLDVKARDGLASYVYDPETTDVDESRFDE